MTKFEFMKELEELLSEISSDERIEALQYYEDYFEDAGPEREQSIISELVSPKKVAASIKADLNASEQELKNRGSFTEKGYEDERLRDPKYEIIDSTVTDKESARSNNTDDSNSENNGRYHTNSQFSGNDNQANGNYNYHSDAGYDKADNSGRKIVLIILLCLFAIPVGIPIIATAFGLFIAVIATVASLWLAFVIVSVVLLFSGVVVTVFGIIKLMTMPAIGMCFTGGGLILFGVGLLFTMATIGISSKVLPVLIRGFVNFCRIPFQNRRAAA